MQPELNSYYHVLTQFDPQNQYLSIDANNQKLTLCNKAALNWIQRFSRWFWKPQNERISYVAKMVFDRINNDMFEQLNFEQLNSEAQNLTHFFQQLGYLSEKADKKQRKSNFQDKTFALHRNCFHRMGMFEKASEPESILELQRSISQLKENKSLVELELSNLQQAYSEKVSQQKIQQESKIAILNELTDKIRVFRAELAQESTKKRDLGVELQNMSKEVEQLSSQRNYLQSDTVLWGDDGYVLCHSSCFSHESMLNAEQMNNMVKRSSQVEQKLCNLEAVNKQASEALRLIPKQVYIESSKQINLKKFIYLVEFGPNKILDYAPDDGLALKSIADFLQQPLPDLKTPFVKKLEKEIASQEKKLNAMKREIASQKDEQEDDVDYLQEESTALRGDLNETRRDLNYMSIKYQRLKSWVKQMRYNGKLTENPPF